MITQLKYIILKGRMKDNSELNFDEVMSVIVWADIDAAIAVLVLLELTFYFK